MSNITLLREGKEEDLQPGLKHSFPLTIGQKRIWFLQQLEPTVPLRHLTQAARLNGLLHVHCLQEALNEIVQRHDSLRTSFEVLDGEPVQRVLQVCAPAVQLTELSHLPEIEWEAAIQSHLQADEAAPFELTRAPLLRARVLRFSPKEHVLIVVTHHIVCDESSTNMFFQELEVLYRAFSNGQPNQVLESPPGYREFVAWQQEWLQSPAQEAQLAFWKQELAGAPKLIELPADHARPGTQSYAAGRESINLSHSTAVALRSLAEQEDCSLFMVVLAAFQALLFRYTGEEDIVVGTLIQSWGVPAYEKTIGRFTNMLLLRTDLSGQPTVRELLRRVRQVVLNAQAHKDMPFEKLLVELQPEANPSYSPLFQVMLRVEEQTSVRIKQGQLEVSPIEPAPGVTSYDLSLLLTATPDGVKGCLEYATDLFSAARMGRMAEHLQSMLEAMPSHADHTIGQVPILTKAERDQLVEEWNRTEMAFPQDMTIPQFIEAQVQRTPEAVAVVFEDKHLTYQELDRRASQLAAYLTQLGVGPETLVGLCVERSLAMIISALAILKAGGAYLPLDPAYPKDRLAFMCQDAQIVVLLTQEKFAGDFALPTGKVVCVDHLQEPTEAARTPQRSLNSDNLAYVMYTSGSTGQPKGVMVTHRNVANFFIAMDRVIGPQPGVWLAVTSISFDISVLELFWTLARGFKVVIHSIESSIRSPVGQAQASSSHSVAGEKSVQQGDYYSIPGLIRRHQVTHFQCTPSHASLLLHEPGCAQAFQKLKKVLVGGEALSASLLQQLEIEGETINVYGPTETTVWSTAWPVDKSASRISIGRPIANTQIYILDAHLSPTPVGITGEIFIGGSGVTRGYLKRPELTAQRFIEDPFSRRPGARLYRTGDLAQWREEGKIEFLGRADHQIKVRGFRIEPGEIESALLKHPEVREAVVIAADDPAGQKQVLAYVVPEGLTTPSSAALRQFLREKLPPYMVPSGFVLLEKLPLTSSGKINRKALPAPHTEAESADQVLPRSPVETKLAQIWCETLGLKQVGIHDNFFDLGGHSLKAVWLFQKIRDVFGKHLPMVTLFQSPTIAQLAEVLQAAAEAPPEEVAALVRHNLGSKVPLSFGQERLWFIQQAEPESATYNLSNAWLLCGPLNLPALQRSLDALVQRHESFRTVFVEQGNQPMQQVVKVEGLEIRQVDLEPLPEEERERHAIEQMRHESSRPFDLTHAPLARGMVLRLSREKHYLLLLIHHIIFDGSSMPILCRELQALYRHFTTGEPTGLPELPLRYADFSASERETLQGQRLEVQLEYWKKQLAGKLPVLELPTDRPRPAQFNSTGALYPFALPAGLMSALRDYKQKTGATSFHVLLAAFQTLLFRYSGQEDLLVGIPFTNRNRSELWDMVGFFVSTQVLRTQVTGEASFGELLGGVQAVTLDAMAHLDAPFIKLVEALNPARDASYTPVFQVMFSYQKMPSLELPGLKSSMVEVHNGRSMFDLTLECHETEEGLRGFFEYRTDLFDAATIERMARHFQRLLEGALGNPELPLERLPLLGEEERRTLMIDWNQTTVDFPLEQTYPQLFDARVSKTPDAPAVQFKSTVWTYAELNARANRLARHLQQLGVGPDVLVALTMDRSLEFVLGALGILKAGGAYLPVDTTQPATRVAQILADARPAVVLTQEKFAGLTAGGGVRVICLDNPEWTGAGENPERDAAPDCPAQPENLAYVIYTSGSTGQPKGVQITHRSLLNHNFAFVETSGLGPADRMLQFFALTFDPSVQEIFPTLVTGGCAVLRTEESLNSFEAFLEFVRRERITIVQVSTSFWHELVEHLKEEPLPDSVRLVTLGGEKAATEKYQAWKQHVSSAVRLINFYGPTEATVTATFFVGGSGNCEDLPIGRPMANVQVYVLDKYLQPVPIGVPGELHIGGAGVARGYHNRPELTAEKFIPDPFSTAPGGRLYKTGDLVRWRADGNLEFLGRSDQQVKVRGFRIEFGEIESALLQHPQVAEAVVSVTDSTTDKRLVAYYVAKGSPPAVAALRQFLKEKLPGYMVPGAFVPLDKLPVTPHGKVDRKALPAAPEQRQLADLVLPRTPTEEKLAQIWCEVLGLKQVGIHDNYFDLGGHSLKAVWLFQKVKQVFGKNLPMVTLFQAPTVAQLAEVVQQEDKSASWSSLVPIKVTGTRPPFFCIHGVGGNILEFLDLAKYMDQEQPFYGLQAVGLDGKRPWLQTVEEMAAHYIQEIRGLQPRGPYHLGGSSFGGLVAYEIAQQLRAQGEEVGLVVFFDTWAPGYPKALPSTSWFRKRLHYWQYRLHLHWSNLMLLPTGKERWAYICTKARKWVHGKRTQLKQLKHYWRQRYAERFLPKEIRQTQKFGLRAALAYVATPYAGRVTLFRATEQPKGIYPEPLLGWDELVKGGIDVYDTPGHHGAIMRDPRARMLAEQLQAVLRKAHENQQCMVLKTGLSQTLTTLERESMKNAGRPEVVAAIPEISTRR